MDAVRIQGAITDMHTERQPVGAWVYGLVGLLWVAVIVATVGVVSAWLNTTAERSWFDLVGPVVSAVVLGFVMMFITGIRVSVDAGELAVKFGAWPKPVRIALSSVTSCRAVTYRPLAEFGGWGIRIGKGGIRAYTARGKRGVLLTIADGRRVLVGSDAPETLVEALSRVGVKTLPAADSIAAAGS